MPKPSGKRRTLMGKITYAPGISTVSGSLARPKKMDGHNHGDYVIATHRTAPTTNPNCNRIYLRKPDTYVRDTNSYSAHELELQQRLTTASRNTHTRMANLSTIEADTAAFKAQKDKPGGKKTFYQYIFNLEYDKLRS